MENLTYTIPEAIELNYLRKCKSYENSKEVIIFENNGNQLIETEEINLPKFSVQFDSCLRVTILNVDSNLSFKIN
jgi:hypothetical protein